MKENCGSARRLRLWLEQVLLCLSSAVCFSFSVFLYPSHQFSSEHFIVICTMAFSNLCLLCIQGIFLRSPYNNLNHLKWKRKFFMNGLTRSTSRSFATTLPCIVCFVKTTFANAQNAQSTSKTISNEIASELMAKATQANSHSHSIK